MGAHDWTEDELDEQLSATFEQLEKALGAPAKALSSLITLDDWSFVIKVHALVEGAVSQWLASTLDERLEGLFRRLNLGRAGGTGKLEFAKSLQLVTKEQMEFIGKLSELRNMLAHDLRHLDFDFKAHIESLDDNQRRSFVLAVARTFPQFRSHAAELQPAILFSPQFFIAIAVLQLIDRMVLQGNVSRMTREENEKVIAQLIRGELRLAKPPVRKGKRAPRRSQHP